MTRSDANGCDLGGIGVLVTRPEHKANALSEMIEQAHGRPIRFPAMEIAGPQDEVAVGEILRKAESADLLIFVSANAVEYALPLLPDALPIELDIAAVGSATAKALTDVGLEPTLVPKERFDSEGLLALPQLREMSDKQVIIVRGNGGRALLGDTLIDRGAKVSYAETYRRLCPQRDSRMLIKGWDRMVDVVLVTSNEILDNLFRILGDAGCERLTDTPLLVVSERVGQHALERGCRQVAIADNATDAALMDALCEMVAE